MGYPLKQSSTAQPLIFLMIDSADHISGKTLISPTVTIRKVGGAFGTPAGAVTEIANGWYQVAGNATDTATLGPLLLHATGTGADPTDDRFDVVAYDPQATSLGLVLAKTTNLTGLNDIAATAIVSSGAITTSGGAVSTVSTVTDKTGYALTTGEHTLIVADTTSALTAQGYTTTRAGYLDNINPASPTAAAIATYIFDTSTVESGVTFRAAMKAIAAAAAGKLVEPLDHSTSTISAMGNASTTRVTSTNTNDGTNITRTPTYVP